MKKAISLILSIPLIFLLDNKGQAQPVQSTNDRPYLALVKGDNNNNSFFCVENNFDFTAEDLPPGIQEYDIDGRDKVIIKEWEDLGACL